MIEIAHPYSISPHIRVAIFDFDGTLSLIRSGWMPLMVSMFLDELIPLKIGENEHAIREKAEDIVLELTGKETIYQMEALASSVRESGGKPLRADVYKAIFLDKLLRLVQSRLAKLRDGSVQTDQFLVPGSRALLDALSARNITLYLASGTDEENVIEETEALDISRYFQDRVYGARNDGRGFTKASLVQYLLSEAGYKPEELVAFGDGVVEIREVSKSAGMTVGVATDEPECRRVDAKKRAHLIAAGANLIVPNFDDGAKLLDAIFPRPAICV